MTIINTQVLASRLQAAADAPNHAQVIAACDDVYSALFRSSDAPVRAGDIDRFDISHRFTLDADDNILPEFDSCDFDIGEVNYFRKKHELFCKNFVPQIVITEDTLMVDTCNYKGEGEGYVPFESVKNNPVFRSKSGRWLRD